MYHRLLTLLALFMLWGTTTIGVSAQTESPAVAPPLQLDNGQEHYWLNQHIELFEDKWGQLAFNEIQSAANAGQFVANTEGTPNYGYTDSAIWVRFQLQQNNRR